MQLVAEIYVPHPIEATSTIEVTPETNVTALPEKDDTTPYETGHAST